MSQPSGKRSFSAVIVGLLLLAGAFLPWRGALDATVLVGLGPGCFLYDAKASEFLEALDTSLWGELVLLVGAALAFIAAGLIKNRSLSRILAFSAVIDVVVTVFVLRAHVASALVQEGVAERLPGWAQAWTGADAFDRLLDGSQLGLGLFFSSIGTAFGLVFALSLLGEAKEDDGRTWLTPLAERSWFFELIEDFWFFLVERKAWWMTPIVVVLIMLVILIIVSEKAAVLPFIYTLF